MSIKEEYIEAQILEFLTLNGVSCEKIVTDGYFDANRWFYRKRKSNFVRKGSSDIQWTIPPDGRSLHIEVKQPEEMQFFDRPLSELTERMIQSKAEKKDKYLRAISQREYLDEKIKAWWVAFFACSIEQVKERLIEQGVIVE